MKKLLIALMFCGTAQAATQGMSVSGTVSSSCAFTNSVNGVFGYNFSNPAVLDTNAAGGTNPSVTIAYNASPTVSIGEITSFTQTPQGFSDSVTFTNIFTSLNNGIISYTSGSASFAESTGTSDTLTLKLRALNNDASFPIGNYGASTIVTCN